MMVTVKFIVLLQTIAMAPEGAAVVRAPGITAADAQAINMTFLVQTLNQVFRPHSVSQVPTVEYEEIKLVIRQEIENLVAGLHQKMQEVCHQNESRLNKTYGSREDDDLIVETIAEAVNRTTEGLGRSLEKTMESHHRNIREHLTNLESRLIRTINEGRHDNQRLLRNIESLGDSLNKSDSVCEAHNFYMARSEDCGSCYNFDMVLRTWGEARNYCRGRGSDLVSIETVEENEFLKKIILRNKNHPLFKSRFGFWTSGSDEYNEGRWEWNATRAALNYTDWLPGQPDNWGGTEHHLHLKPSGRWNDLRDSNRMNAICERRLIC